MRVEFVAHNQYILFVWFRYIISIIVRAFFLLFCFNSHLYVHILYVVISCCIHCYAKNFVRSLSTDTKHRIDTNRRRCTAVAYADNII